jgi:serine palmitoyltransferase
MGLISSFVNTSSILHAQGHTFAAYLLSLSRSSLPALAPSSLMSLLQSYRAWWLDMYRTNPFHVMIETGLIVFMVLTVVATRGSKPGKYSVKLTEKEKQELLDTWVPEELTPDLSDEEREVMRGNQVPVTGYSGSHFTKETVIETGTAVGTTVNTALKTVNTTLNMANFDFLGLATRKSLKQASAAALTKYGCGSCGPRGFYGTIKPHLSLEALVAHLTSTSDSIMYSDANSCVSSTIAAFSKRGDQLVVDEGLYESLTTGVGLSRSNVKTFKHNDMHSLRQVLEKLRSASKGAGAQDQRRFVVVEGIYRMHGDIAPLDEIVKLKDEFGYRLIVDESLSFGVMGKTGLGACEHYGVCESVEIRTISLENVVGAVGGITVGDDEVVDHQRLSGAGYCFSASAPPFVAKAAMDSCRVIVEEGEQLRKVLVKNVASLRKGIESVKGIELWGGDERSPLVFFRLTGEFEEEERARKTKELARAIVKGGVSVVCSSDYKKASERFLIAKPGDNVRLTVNVCLTKKMIEDAVGVIKRCVEEL